MELVEIRKATKPGQAASLVYGWDAKPDVEGIQATVEDSKSGITYVCSKFAATVGGYWKIDAAFKANGIPMFVHGTGSVLSPRARGELYDVLVDAEAVATLTGGLS